MNWVSASSISVVVQWISPFIPVGLSLIHILTAIVISVLLWAYPSNPYVWCVLVVLVGYGVIGFVDDYRKVVRKDTKGLIARWKYFWMSVIALGVAFALYLAGKDTPATQLVVPFFKDVMPQLGLFYILLAYFVIVGTGNAVNLTDGLDGLAIMPTVFVAGGFALVAWATGNMNFASYLHIPYLRHAGELVIVCTAIVGAGLGFLWFNTCLLYTSNKHFSLFLRKPAGIKRHTDATGTVNQRRYVLKCRSRRKLTLYICCGK